MLNSASDGAGGVDGSLQLPLPSMNSLNQTVSILPFWALFKDYFFLYFDNFTF
jgi:hypothetical protein